MRHGTSGSGIVQLQRAAGATDATEHTMDATVNLRLNCSGRNGRLFT